MAYMVAMVTTVAIATRNCTITTQQHESIWHKCSLWQYIDNLVGMKTLLPWQQVNCAITQLYVLSPY